MHNFVKTVLIGCLFTGLLASTAVRAEEVHVVKTKPVNTVVVNKHVVHTNQHVVRTHGRQWNRWHRNRGFHRGWHHNRPYRHDNGVTTVKVHHW